MQVINVRANYSEHTVIYTPHSFSEPWPPVDVEAGLDTLGSCC